MSLRIARAHAKLISNCFRVEIDHPRHGTIGNIFYYGNSDLEGVNNTWRWWMAWVVGKP